MKKWSNKIPYFIFALGIIMDIGVNLTGFCLVTVTEAYMDYLFSGIITVSILCFTFVTLISSFLNNDYFGYKLKDIIQFPASPVNMKKYISVSLFSIAIAVCLLAANFEVNCVNSMTMLLLALVWLEGNIAFKIYDMITNEKCIFDLVISHFSTNVNMNEMNFEEFQLHTDKIICALTSCISENDSNGKDKLCNMLAELSVQIQKKEGKDNYYNYYNYFNVKIRECMDSFAMVFGFNAMLNSIVKIYTRLSEFEYGRIDLYVIPINNMRFWNDQLLLERNYFEQMAEVDLLEIYKKKQISNLEVEKIFYEYFNSIMNNCICTKNVRDQLVEMYIAELMKLHWKTNENGVEPDINNLLNILKYFVLKNNNIEERNYVFQMIVKQAFYNNIPYNREKYFGFLALFFQAFYAYIFCEGETLNKKYREGLQETFSIEFSSETITKMSSALLLRIHIQDILLAIGQRIANGADSLERRFENFPSYIMAKSVVWTSEFNIDFLFMLYLIYYDEVGFYSIYEAFFDWKAISDETKIFVLGELQKKFDMKSGLLKNDFVEKYTEFGDLLKHLSTITEQIQKKLFEHISKAYTDLKQKNIGNQKSISLDMDYKDIMEKINELMNKEEVFGWNAQYTTECHVKFVIPDCICRREYRTAQSTARTIQKGIIEAVKSYIRQRSDKLILSFDLSGVKKMLNFISGSTYNARNYTFTDDWSLGKLRKEPDFIRLEEEQKKIELVNTPQIHENMYFNKENFCFNAKISKMEFLDLSERECASFLEDSKCYNGLYNVDGALMAKEEAMKYVKKIYCKERYSFRLMISLNREDTTCIEFEH